MAAFRYHIVSGEMFSVVREQLTMHAASEWPGVGGFSFRSPVIAKQNKTKTPYTTGVLLYFAKAVLFWLQVQDSWAIGRGKMDNVRGKVKRRRALKSRP